jgi:hypothetical protein
MTTVQELLVDVFVAAAAIASRQFCRDRKTVVILLFLCGGGLVAVQAIHALPCVHAQLEFVDH